MDLERNAMDMGNMPALLLVDMINGFTNSACSLGSDCPDVVAANAVLLSEFRRLGLPIFYTTVVFHNDDQAKVFRGRIDALNQLTPDSNWVKVDPKLAMQEGEVLIEKQWASSFHQTDLHEQLQACEVDSLVVTGLTTSGCVRATVVDGLQYDYRVFVPREAVGDRNQDAHQANLFDMHAKYADVISLDEAIKHIRRSQGK
ncbi:isochorismatase family protein [Temperatibacter marinus]|uniref:Isochorismatase family protein n=1 Tax=Temperatibacter marinus TaxID=1456591 RepID=A0AA52HBD8_9PROT|nr:isochorismatase family protein [Temperatibacter marinus]WND03533.1 isochorismatase family protein [Temperatibacter marinus]